MKDYIKTQIGAKSKFPQQLLSMPASDIHFEQKLWFCVKLAGHFNQQAPTSEYVGSMQKLLFPTFAQVRRLYSGSGMLPLLTLPIPK